MIGSSFSIIADNKKARYNYFIEDTIEVGIVLKGTEVKSLFVNRANIQDAYVAFYEGEAFIYNMHISQYKNASYNNHEPKAIRKLLLHRRQIAKFALMVKTKGISIVPLRIYFNDRRKVKLSIAIAKGKKLYDKRADEKRKMAAKDMQRAQKIKL